ncbi:glutathione S-transferase family protein [Marinagarivorans algicola]|uniref:glutathione S-transferase family protein n=1 Tax=Marinagarivorans algicola TaxID=1513270 RepID=UPI0006B49B54|nr:glutathione S-transferase family protein [Marinagarivorans algicola]
MLTVHHLNQSRSTRILWLLEELAIDYKRVDYQRDAVTHLAPDTLKLVHPLGKAPILVDDTVTLCESSTIIEYVLDQYSEQRLRPAQGSQSYYQYLEWSHFAEGSLALPVVTSTLLNMETRDGQQPMDGYIAKEANVDFTYIDNTLSKQPYFAGDEFTAADIMMAVSLDMASRVGLLKGKEHTLAYLKKVQQRPAYIKAKSFG